MSTPLADVFEATLRSSRAAEMHDSETAAALVVDVVQWVATHLPKDRQS